MAISTANFDRRNRVSEAGHIMLAGIASALKTEIYIYIPVFPCWKSTYEHYETKSAPATVSESGRKWTTMMTSKTH